MLSAVLDSALVSATSTTALVCLFTCTLLQLFASFSPLSLLRVASYFHRRLSVPSFLVHKESNLFVFSVEQKADTGFWFMSTDRSPKTPFERFFNNSLTTLDLYSQINCNSLKSVRKFFNNFSWPRKSIIIYPLSIGRDFPRGFYSWGPEDYDWRACLFHERVLTEIVYVLIYDLISYLVVHVNTKTVSDGYNIFHSTSLKFASCFG